jgi:hypothetical protein
VRQILLHPLGIFDSYVCLIQNKIFFGTLRRISDLTNLAVTSWAFSCFLNPGLYGSDDNRMIGYRYDNEHHSLFIYVRIYFKLRFTSTVQVLITVTAY